MERCTIARHAGYDRGMTEAENLVLDHLRHIRADLADLKTDMREVKEPLGILEQQVAGLSGQYASLSVRLDRTAADIERIKNRLELTEA